MPSNSDEFPTTAEDILKAAIKLEIDGAEFFRIAAGQTDRANAQEFFESLVDDEVQHRKILERQYKSVMDTGKWAPEELAAPTGPKYDSPVLGKEFAESLKGTLFQASALSIGLMLEEKSIEFYREAQTHTDDPEALKLLKWLEEWERGHLNAIAELEKVIRQDYWHAAGFEPF
jgi:rubrerythrin